jgi:serine/threonine protein phosphatase PrpC
MEDVHVIHAPNTWSAPHPSASFIGVYDGHGGRLIVDYLEDHLSKNVAQEWRFESGQKCGDDDSGNVGHDGVAVGRKRRLSTTTDGDDDDENHDSDDEGVEEEEEKDDAQIIRNSLERAFLLTDIQSRMAGLTTSGATVVCTIIIPKFDNTGKCTEIEIHAANAGDARAVLSSTIARSVTSSSSSTTDERRNIMFSEDDLEATTNSAVRITHDHKSTDSSEIQRIRAAGGDVIRNRVLGILAVARSLGDHGLKEFVIAKPYLSSTVVSIERDDDDDDEKMVVSNNDSSKGSGEPNNDTTKNNNQPTSHPFTDGEFLIVACDGLWDVMEDDEAVHAVRDHVAKNGLASRTEVASILVNEALERGSTDNITVIVKWL